MKIDMKKEWKNQIDRLDIIIRNTSIFCDGRVQQLLDKRELLEKAFNSVGVEA